MGRIDDSENFDVDAEANEAGENVETPAEQGEQSGEADTEAAVESATDDEAKAAEAARKAEEAAKVEAEYNAAWNAFVDEVEKAVTSEEVDQSTGTLHEALKVPVMLAYSKLPGAKGKNAAKNYLQEKMQDRMLAGAEDNTQFTVARSYLDLIKEIGKGGVKGEQVVRQPVDPTDAHVARVAALFIAPNLVLEPEGVKSDWKDRVKALAKQVTDEVQTYRAWLDENKGKSGDDRSQEPEVHDVVKAAARIAQGRGAGGGAGRKVGAPKAPSAGGGAGGARRNVEAHIREAFAGKNPGDFMSIAEIANATSSEYGDDHPSSGAVAARLFPKGDPSKCTLDFVRPAETPKKGAVLI